MSEAESVSPALNLMEWVHANRDQLKPPVGNKYLYDGKGLFAMIVVGPNARNDFHVTNSEEFFFQLQGDIVVRIREKGEIKDCPVREGEAFFIPANVPHSPIRPPNTIGVVVERRRPPGETEHQQFYCDNCGELVHDKEFDCADIVEHFAQSMAEFWADPELNTCKSCGTANGKPTPIKRIIFEPQILIERE
ncbi:MAG: 3-hydroxyanthranilate 3,4-dioxygenase [Phycisphaerales bacterium]